MPFLSGSSIEIVGPPAPAHVTPRAALFDWDGTISLVRSGWDHIMIEMMLEVLGALGSGETAAELEESISEPVFRLTGKPTIHQMMELADQVRRRGGTPLEPAEYLAVF